MRDSLMFIILLTTVHPHLAPANGGEPTLPKTAAQVDADVREAIRKLRCEKAEDRLAGIAHLSLAPEKAVSAIPHLIKVLGEESVLPPTWYWYPWMGCPPGSPLPPTPAKSAAKLLVKIGKPAVPPLIAVVGDDRAVLRGNAAWVLGQISDPRAAQPVLDRLDDKDAFVRRSVVLALGAAGNWQVGGSLRATLGGTDAELRGLAAVALGSRKDKQAVDALIGALEDRDSLVQEAAVWALGQIKTPKAMEALLARLKAAPSRHVMTIVGRLKEPRAVEPMIALLRHENHRIRKYAAEMLGAMKDRSAVGPLITSLSDQHCWVRVASASALGSLGDMQAVQPLMDLLKDRRIEVQRSAAKALGRLKARPAVELLTTMLKKDEVYGQDACRQAVWALGEIGDRRAVRPLVGLLRYKEPYYVRQPVVVALGKLKDSRAVEPLLDCLTDVKDDDPLVHRHYYRCIGHVLKQIDDPKTAHGLARLVESENVFWRCGAIGAYGGMGAVGPLLAALSNDMARVRRMAAWELAEIGDTRAVPLLKKLLSSEGNEHVITAAKWALRTIEARRTCSERDVRE